MWYQSKIDGRFMVALLWQWIALFGVMASIETGIDFSKATATQQEAIPSLLLCPRADTSGSSCPPPETAGEPNSLEESSF